MIEACNCLVRYGDGVDWMPAIYHRDDLFCDPRGLKIITPPEWKMATPQEIQTYLDENNIVMVRL